jgi:hypothetical protein
MTIRKKKFQNMTIRKGQILKNITVGIRKIIKKYDL